VLDLADVAPDAQLELARSAEDGERFFLLASEPAEVLRDRGLLAPGLARVLDPTLFVVPPLRERRDEIPGLVRVLADDFARAASLAPARFDDGAMADLWRQDWRGNAIELGALVADLARAFPGRELGAPEVRAALRSRGLEFRARLPSRPPSALDLELALASTRHRVGSENLARAARYLGWDADTLRAHLDRPGRRRGE
jgi:DNA-binding NtrC family response regulator